MVYGKKDCVGFPAGRSQIDCRFAAITSYFKAWSQPACLKGNFINTPAFIFVKKAFDVFLRDFDQAAICGVRFRRFHKKFKFKACKFCNHEAY